MKKAFSFLLAVLLVIAICPQVLATTIEVDNGTTVSDVTGSYEAGAVGGTVISVEIAWNNLDFTYHAASEAVWDPGTCTYSEPIEAGWKESNASITVTNRSNTAISAVPVYQAEAGFEAAGVSFSSTALQVASAEEGGPQTASITVTPTGTLPEGTSSAVIGHITVTVQAVSGAASE